MSVVNSWQLFLNSSQRSSGTNASPTWLLNPPIRPSRSTSVLEVRVQSCSIPFSFDQVNATNNVLFGSVNMVGFSVTIPEGNYNITDLLATLVAAINAAATIAGGGTTTLAMAYNRSTGRCTATLNAAPGNLRLIYSSNFQLMRMMGFQQDVYLLVGASQVGDIKVNVNPVSYVFIRSSTLNQADLSREALLSKGETTDILLDVPVTVSPGAIVTYTNPAAQGVRIVNREVSDVQLYLSSDLNFSLDLGGVPWVACVVVSEVQLPPPPPDDLMAVTMRAVAPVPMRVPDADKARLDELAQRDAKLRAEADKARAALEKERERLLDRIRKEGLAV